CSDKVGGSRKPCRQQPPSHPRKPVFRCRIFLRESFFLLKRPQVWRAKCLFEKDHQKAKLCEKRALHKPVQSRAPWFRSSHCQRPFHGPDPIDGDRARVRWPSPKSKVERRFLKDQPL